MCVKSFGQQCGEVVWLIKQSTTTVKDHDNTMKALKKAKSEVTRLTNKNNEAQKNI